MLRKNGFTLIEVIFVLGILSLLITLSVPIQRYVIEKQQDKQFLQMLQSDILYLQGLNYASKDYTRLTFDLANNHYKIEQGMGSKILVERKFPADWKVDLNTLSSVIYFSPYGQIIQPGTMTITTNQATYDVIFPFGKGRFYIEKQ